MLLDFSCFGPLTIDPSQYPTTLTVRIDTGNRPDCGVFAGKNLQFARHEVNKLVPCIEDDDGTRVYLLDRPESQAKDHVMARWDYAAIGWEGDVYVEHPYVWTLTLQELNHGPFPGPSRWHISFSQNHDPAMTLILLDYKPGALARGDYKAALPDNSDFGLISQRS
jgi:hypothetical protein